MFFIVVEEVRKKQGYKLLECSVGKTLLVVNALLVGKKWEGHNPEKVWQFSRRYAEEHKEEKEVYNVIKNTIAGK